MPLKLIPPGKRKKKGKPTNPYYLVRGSINGERYEVSTDTKDKAEAKAFKRDFERAIEDGQRDPDEPATVSDAIDIYRTKKTPTGEQKRLVDRLDYEIGDRHIDDINDAALSRIARQMYPGVLGQTLNRSVVGPMQAIRNVAAKSICSYYLYEKFPEQDPEQPIVKLSLLQHIIDKATDPEGRAVLLCITYQGWRISETLNALREKTDFRQDKIDLYIGKIKQWKTIALDEEVSKYLRALPKREDGRFFRWRDRHNFYRDFLTPHLAGLGLSSADFTPHMARRAFATDLLEDDISPKSVQESSTWKSVNSVLRYHVVDETEQRRVIYRRRKTGGETGGKKTKTSKNK